MGAGLYERIYAVVRQIPRGRVSTYGDVAREAGIPNGARQVGYAMAALGRVPRPDVPWHRVVNAKGESSLGDEQLTRLREEGILVDGRGRIDLQRFGWRTSRGRGDDLELFG
ncbi:MAG: MGMT family protein [Candidatus Bipolaricaulota bacterium]